MRGLRSLVILIVIAIPLGYLVYRDSQSTPGDDEPLQPRHLGCRPGHERLPLRPLDKETCER